MKEMTLKTMTSSGVPNLNGVIYSKEEFEKMLENTDVSTIVVSKVCNYEDKSIENYLTIHPETIVCNVTSILDGSIRVEIPDDKIDFINEVLNKGFLPGMRYLGELSDRDEKGFQHVSNMKLICYDFVTSIQPDIH